MHSQTSLPLTYVFQKGKVGLGWEVGLEPRTLHILGTHSATPQALLLS